MAVTASSELTSHNRLAAHTADGQFQPSGAPNSLGGVWETSGIGFGSPQDDRAPWIQWDLGSVQRITRMEVWNFPESSPATKRGQLEISNDGQSFAAFQEVSLLSYAGPETPDRFDFSSLNARFVRLRVLEIHGGDTYPLEPGTPIKGFSGFAGLTEVRFVGSALPPLPTITGHPQGQEVELDAPVTFRVTLSSTSGVSWQWLRNGAELPGRTLDTLEISHAQFSDAGEYRVRISNGAESQLSNPATLTVKPGARVADDFNDNLKHLSLWAGSDVGDGGAAVVEDNQRLEYRVAVPAVGGFDEAYRPLADLIPVPGDQNWEATVDVRQTVTPATGKSAAVGLTVSHPTEEHGVFLELYALGTRRGVVTGLDADGDPVGVDGDTGGLGLTDGSLRLAFQAQSRVLSAFYDADGAANGAAWKFLAAYGLGTSGGTHGRDNWSLGAGSRLRLALGGYSEGTVIPAGAAYLDNFVFTVGGPATGPQIQTPPANLAVLPGQAAQFTVAATGTAPLGYQWRKGGVPLANGGRISGADSATLVLADVVAGDAGSYDVIVNNLAGAALSSAAVLEVLPPATPPNFTDQPDVATVLQGQVAVFAVKADGTAPLTYQWRQGGTALSNGGRITGANTATLTLLNVQPGDAGDYDVVVSNAAGSKTSEPATLTVASLPTTGEPGTLDLSFDAGAALNRDIFEVARQADGKILIAGSFTSVDGAWRRRLARLNPDLSTDHTFLHGLSAANNQVISVVPQADGKVLLVGLFDTVNNTPRSRVARLNADGSLDAGFNPGTGANDTATCLAIQPDGKVLVGGHFTAINGVARNRIARLNADGSVDTGFDPGTGANNQVWYLVLQPDGKVVVGGTFTEINGVARNRIARLNADGSVDLTFNPGTGASGRVETMALQPDGKILIGGFFTGFNGTARSRVARLNADGSLDTTFNPGSGANNSVYSLKLQPDGKVVIGGWFTAVNGTPRNRIARLNANGSVDTGFNPGTGANADIGGLVVEPDGGIVIGGAFFEVNGMPRNRIARLNADGSLADGGNGTAGPDSELHALAVQPDGKVLVGGSMNFLQGARRDRVARLNADGRLDATFQPVSLGQGQFDALALQPDGKVLVAGGFIQVNGVTRSGIARLNANGELDSGFDPGTGANQVVSCLAVQPDGKVVLGGSFTTFNGSPRGRLARLNSDGSLDAAFTSGSGADSAVGTVVVQPDGRVVVAGSFTDINGTARNRIARLNADGGLDVTFDPGTGANNPVRAVVLQPDGKVVLGGLFTSINGTPRNRIARLNANGSLDTTFDPGAGADNSVHALALQPDGMIVVGGLYSRMDNRTRIRLARLNANGGLDLSFIPDGGADSSVDALALQPDGRIVLAGGFGGVDGVPRTSVARLFGTPPSLAITQPPASVTVAAGQPAEFTVTATGTPPLSYQWRKGGVAVSNGGNLSGADSATLRLADVQAADAGTYDVVVSNAAGSQTSDPAVLTVETPTVPQKITGLTATATSELAQLGRVAANTLNGIYQDANFWESVGTVEGFGEDRDPAITFDLKSPRRLDHFLIWNAHEFDPAIKRMAVEVSLDGVNFTRLPGEVALTFNALATPQKVPLGGVTARFVRLDLLENHAGVTFPVVGNPSGWSLVAINEVEFYATGGGTAGLPVADFLEWYRADSAQFAGLADGTPIVNWLPEAGSSATPVPVQVAGQEIVHRRSVATMNGQPALEFVGGSSVINNIGTVNFNGVSMFLVFRNIGSGALQRAVNGLDSNTLLGPWSPSHGNYNPAIHLNGAWTLHPQDVVGWSDPATGVLGVVVDAVATEKSFLNGVEIGPSTPMDTTTVGRLSFGGAVGAFGEPYKGYIAEFIVYKRALSVAETAEVHRYLLDKYGVGGPSAERPTVVSHPANVIVTAGQTAQFTVAATGTAPLTYQWRKGGVALTNGGNISGADTATLTLASLQVADAGDYDVVVGNAAGSQPSNPATLTVQPAPVGPTITVPPVSLTVTAGQPAEFTVTATGTAPLTYQWRKGGVALANGGTLSGADAATLRLAAAQAADAGTYDVVVSNPAGSQTSAPATLTVKVPPIGPTITSPPVSVTVAAGQDAVFTVTAAGTAPLAYQWFFTPAAGGAEQALPNANAATLTLAGAMPGQAGTYRVRVSNEASPSGIYSPPATLTVTAVSGAFVNRRLPGAYVPGKSFEVVLEAKPAATVAFYAVADRPPVGWTVSAINEGGLFDARSGEVKFGPFADNAARNLRYTLLPPAGASGRAGFTGLASADGIESVVGGTGSLEPALNHPADLDADQRLAINEATGYGAAWKRGESWTLPPNPVPVNYVTRAGFLWRNGELYRLDPAAGSAPLWWVPETPATPNMVRQAVGSPSTATRSFVGSAATVEITPAAAVSVYAVEERLFAGFTASDISHGGTYLAAEGLVRWGPFFDSQPRTLTYTVTAPTAFEGEIAVLGLVSEDGESFPVTGASVLRFGAAELPPPVTPEFAGDSFQLDVAGPLNARVIIETAESLGGAWTVATEFELNKPGQSWSVPVEIQESGKFFRVRVIVP